MWANYYAKRVTQDLEIWREKGWVNTDGAAAIRASLSSAQAVSRLPVVISILGAVLIGFSAMAFVAANWQDMSKALRLALLGVTMWTAYGAALWAHLQNRAAFAEVALLIGVALFGANIMLVGQMYHLPSDFSAGLLAWALGAAIVAWAVNSKSALIAAQLLFLGWTGTEMSEGRLHLWYFLPWAIMTLLAFRLNWAPAKHLAIIGLFFWLLGNTPPFAELIGLEALAAVACLSTLFAIGWIASLYGAQQHWSFADATQAYLALALFVMLWLTHMIDDGMGTRITPLLFSGLILIVAATAYAASRKVPTLALVDIAAFAVFPAAPLIAAMLVGENGDPALWVLAPLFLIMSVWLVAFGSKQSSRFLINLGFATFAAETLYLYFETFGTLLDTAAFFLMGGILLIAGGLVWEKLRRRATAPQLEASS